MRTTLTLEDDLAALLKQRAGELGMPFKVVVNQAIRRGLDPAEPAEAPAPKTLPHHFGFRPGIDLDRMNQLADQLEAEAAVAELVREQQR